MNDPGMTLPQYLAALQQTIEQTLDRWVPAEVCPPETLHKAMRYSLFAGGKRIRPVLCISAAAAVADAPVGVENADDLIADFDQALKAV